MKTTLGGTPSREHSKEKWQKHFPRLTSLPVVWLLEIGPTIGPGEFTLRKSIVTQGRGIVRHPIEENFLL
jgi:hypothetical protein